MYFSFTQRLQSLELDKVYTGTITSAILYQGKGGNRVLINTEVSGYADPPVASFSDTERGAALLTKLLSSLDATPDEDFTKVLKSIVGKQVCITVSYNGDYLNTTLTTRPGVSNPRQNEELPF